MVSVRSLTSRRSSASKSRTGSAGVRSTGSPNNRIGLTLTKPLLIHVTASTLRKFYPSHDLGRVELNPYAAGLFARGAACRGDVQRVGQVEGAAAVNPDQGPLHLLAVGRPDLHRAQYLGLRWQLGGQQEIRQDSRGGTQRRHPH